MIQMRYGESLNSRKGRDSGSWRRGTYMGEDITQLGDGVHSMEWWDFRLGWVGSCPFLK